MSKKLRIMVGVLLGVIFAIALMTIKPGASNIEGTVITSCTSTDEKKFTISWKRVYNVDGHEIAVARDSDFNTMVGTIKTKQKSQTRIAGLISGRTYYIRMRGYRSTSDGKVYGNWSNVKCITIHSHNYVLSNEISPTCQKDGSYKYVCSCGKSYSKVISKVNHKYKLTNRVYNCDKASYDEYTCEYCGDLKKETTAQVNHDYKMTETTNARTYTCIRCGHNYSEKKEIQAAGIDKEYTIDLGNGQTTTVVGHFDTAMADEIFNLLNQYRKEQGIYQLTKGSSKLQDAANIRAYEIVNNFAHYRPNGERALVSFNSTTDCCAENIAKYQKSAAQVMQGWKDSPGHNKTMLTSVANSVSISVFAERKISGDTIYYYYHFVQLFAW